MLSRGELMSSADASTMSRTGSDREALLRFCEFFNLAISLTENRVIQQTAPGAVHFNTNCTPSIDGPIATNQRGFALWKSGPLAMDGANETKNTWPPSQP